MENKLTATELATRIGPWTHRDPVLYRALAACIEDLIRQGRLAPWTRLPAERSLAERLTVSRGTVMAAYESLRERGLVTTVHGSGTVVRPDGSPVTGPREAHVATALPFESLLSPSVVPSDGTLDLRSASWVGSEALAAIEPEKLHGSLVASASGGRVDVLGTLGLRTAIARRLTRSGTPTTPDEILVTGGAQQAISLTIQLYLGAGDTAVAEDPTYPGAVEAMVAQQARVRRVPVGRAGVDLPSLRAAVEAYSPRLVYLIPSVHNPTGTVMPGAARQRLAELAADWHTVIIDDTTLLETQLDGTPPPPLAAYADDATAARIITVGSLSKAIWDGLRIGWVRAAASTIERLVRLKALADLGTPLLTQAVAEQLLTRDGDDPFDRRRQELRERRDLATSLLEAHLPSWRWEGSVGGLCLWIDTGLDDTTGFCRVAAQHRVAILPAAASSATRQFAGHLRLPYALPTASIEEGVRRLAGAWKAHVGHTPDQRTTLKPAM